MSTVTDTTTDLWVRNRSDELAVENGCRFDVLRGAWTVWWIERFCKLYEGDGFAGEPLILHGCHECDHSGLYAVKEWDEGLAQERAALFAECVRSGHRIDWQYECLMRLFGWATWSDHWDREIRRFRQGSVWVSKKAKKSPTLAAIGLYLTCGDGEPGQKVFFGAKDGKQARGIVGAHAFEMLRQSEELGSECTPNLSSMRITHEPSRSFMEPLSSSNVRTQKSKEGLNGSLLIDETHVVDREFIGRLTRAGMSRPEPLHLEFSTAGDDPDSYGKERFDRALRVISGEIEDQKLFAAVYAAPQDLTDEELDRDPLEYGRMANPAFGHTIDPVEFLDDYNQSKSGTVEDFAKFKMYRLNIWQQSSNPWLRDGEWSACGQTYTESDLLGKTCWGGLDLALTRDTVAFVLVFPEGEGAEPTFRLWPYIFLPEATAQQTRNEVRWFDFARDKHLTITDGNETDFMLVRQTIREAAKKFDLRGVGYDPKYAAILAQELREEDRIEAIEFGQTPMNFMEPIAKFEHLIVARRLAHPTNSCLTWQARNARKKRTGMLQKPEENDVKKIDAIVAAVMGLGMAMRHQETAWKPEDGVYL